MDLISREAALNATKMVYIECIFVDDCGYEVDECDDLAVVFAKDIKALPAVDAVPVVHGRWIPIVEKVWNLDIPVVVDWKCSVCNGMGNEDFNYCPTCGAKMDGGNNG